MLPRHHGHDAAGVADGRRGVARLKVPNGSSRARRDCVSMAPPRTPRWRCGPSRCWRCSIGSMPSAGRRRLEVFLLACEADQRGASDLRTTLSAGQFLRDCVRRRALGGRARLAVPADADGVLIAKALRRARTRAIATCPSPKPPQTSAGAQASSASTRARCCGLVERGLLGLECHHAGRRVVRRYARALRASVHANAPPRMTPRYCNNVAWVRQPRRSQRACAPRSTMPAR